MVTLEYTLLERINFLIEEYQIFHNKNEKIEDLNQLLSNCRNDEEKHRVLDDLFAPRLKDVEEFVTLKNNFKVHFPDEYEIPPFAIDKVSDITFNKEWGMISFHIKNVFDVTSLFSIIRSLRDFNIDVDIKIELNNSKNEIVQFILINGSICGVIFEEMDLMLNGLSGLTLEIKPYDVIFQSIKK